MKTNTKMILWNASFNRSMFRKELEKLVSDTNEQEIYDILIYCYDKYSDAFSEILLDVFSNRKEFSKKVPAIYAESLEAEGILV